MKKLAMHFALALAVAFSVSAEHAQTPTPAPDLKLVDGMNDCVASSYEKGSSEMEHLFLKNNCKAPVHVYYFSTGPDSGGTYLKPGQVENTHLVHDKITTNGGVAIYACPSNAIPVTDEGKFAANKKEGQPFRCRLD